MAGKKKKSAGSHFKQLQGTLDVTRSGMGFVIVPEQDADVMVKREFIGQAFDGDTVVVEVINQRKSGKQEGRIVEVKKRKQTEFSGRIQLSDYFAFFIPDNEKVNTDFFVPLHLLDGANDGDHVVVKMVEWPPKAKNPVGEVIAKLKDEPANEIAMKSLLMEAGFPLQFPDEVLENAARFTDHIDEEELKKRRDFREVLTFTIDPDDAKDFDDAISFQKLKNGHFEIGVHIADVSHFVVPGTALDKEAYLRATSVYLPDRVIPMLPENLSNHLCSLRPDEEKYAFSAVFEMNDEGEVFKTWLGRTVIKSQRRFTYQNVQDMIEGSEGDHKSILLTVNAIAQKLRAKRFAEGAINFSSTEVRFKLDEQAKPIGIVLKESKEAHQLIEELMLLANRSVAEYVSGIKIKDKPIPFPYRVHDIPDEEKLKIFAAFAGRYGYIFKTDTPEKIGRSFNEMLNLVKGKPEQHVLETLGIRTMAKAVYTSENIGHYGLGFEKYCHFTSPIRRYPDVMVHRVLQECLDQNIHPAKQMEAQCRHCSEQEKRAMDTERSANKYKQVEFLEDKVGEEYEAVVSGVSTFGFWAETVEHKCEGMVSMQELMDIDQFEHQPEEYALVGRNTGLKIMMGDKMHIKVLQVNLERRQIDFGIVGFLNGNKMPLRKENSKLKSTKNTSKKKSRKK